MFRVARNLSAGPLPADREGRQLAGGEWGVVDDEFDDVQRASEAGLLALVEVDVDSEDVDPDARQAALDATTVEHRRQRLAELPGQRLHEIAAEHELDSEDLELVVTRLAHRSDVAVPTGRPPDPPSPPAPPVTPSPLRTEE